MFPRLVIKHCRVGGLPSVSVQASLVRQVRNILPVVSLFTLHGERLLAQLSHAFGDLLRLALSTMPVAYSPFCFWDSKTASRVPLLKANFCNSSSGIWNPSCCNSLFSNWTS
jgi:hypothetical protein